MSDHLQLCLLYSTHFISLKSICSAIIYTEVLYVAPSWVEEKNSVVGNSSHWIDSMWFWGWVCHKHDQRLGRESLNGRAVHRFACFPISRRCLSRSDLMSVKIKWTVVFLTATFAQCRHPAQVHFKYKAATIKAEKNIHMNKFPKMHERHFLLLACRQRR